MAQIPPFDADGLLPPADYEVSFEELRKSILIVGPADAKEHSSWDRPWPWNCIRMCRAWGSAAELLTSTVTSWSFHRPFGNAAAMADRGAS